MAQTTLKPAGRSGIYLAMEQRLRDQRIAVHRYLRNNSGMKLGSNVRVYCPSGSMDGPRIVSARQALLVFLKSLPPGCYFNVVSFGSNFELLFSRVS